jgi:hypothetical protein
LRVENARLLRLFFKELEYTVNGFGCVTVAVIKRATAQCSIDNSVNKYHIYSNLKDDLCYEQVIGIINPDRLVNAKRAR